MITTKTAFMENLDQYMKLAKVMEIHIMDQNGQITWILSSVKQENILRKLLNIVHPGKRGCAAEVPA